MLKRNTGGRTAGRAQKIEKDNQKNHQGKGNGERLAMVGGQKGKPTEQRARGDRKDREGPEWLDYQPGDSSIGLRDTSRPIIFDL